MAQSLSGYTFEWDPDETSMPYSSKTVAEVQTFGGTELFEWEASIVGKEVVLKWDHMEVGMFNALRRRYLVMGTTYVWDPDIGGNTFNVVIKDFSGKYLRNFTENSSYVNYRENVVMVLSIRSRATTMTTSTTTSTTTT
jgi:hypothetical protein